MVPETGHHFERWSNTYDRSFMQWVLFDRVHRIVLHAVSNEHQPKVVLDIGCGTGRLLHKVKNLWPQARLIGVDPTDGMIAKAQAALPEGEFSIGSAEKLPIPDDSVDVILSTVSFHHWFNQPQGICEVARVLAPGGRFYLADMVPPVWISKIRPHGKPIYPPSLLLMFEQAKLKLISQRHGLGGFLHLYISEKQLTVP